MNETARFSLIAVGVIGVLFSPLAFFMGTCTRPSASRQVLCRIVNDTNDHCPTGNISLKLMAQNGLPDIDLCFSDLFIADKAEALGCGKNVKGGIWYAD